MRLATRLLLIILVCLLPTVGLSTFVLLDQRAERQAQVEALVLRQAELLNGDITSIAEGARSLLTTAAEFGAIAHLDPGCEDRLVAVKHNLPSYGFLALLDSRGRVVCASAPQLAFAASGRPGWVRDALDAQQFGVGRYAAIPGLGDGFVPFFLPIGAQEMAPAGVLVAALDLDWLAAHLAELKTIDSRLLHSSVLSIADRDGTVLARNPRHDDFVGRRFPTAVLSLVNADRAGVARVSSIDGSKRIVGYIPTRESGAELMVAVGFSEPDLMADIDRASYRGAALLFGAALAAVALTLLVARRFIGRPTAQLLAAARRWREGDFRARAAVPEDRSEFGQIAAVYNDMAAALEMREAELLQHAQLLEQRVAERTRELAESNNRLLVEIAERRETEAALAQAQKLQIAGQLAGGIAHDFNNLLATILGSLQLLGRELDPRQTRQRAMIERASDAVQRGAQLTGRLLAFSRRKRLAVRSTDLNRLIVDLGALLDVATLGRRIQVETRLDPALWPAMAEPSQIEAAVLNLALNARDAMPNGGLLIIRTVNETVTAHDDAADLPPGQYVRITVSDTGAGMSAEVAQRAREPFFTTKGASGSGLGLSQVTAVAQELGGALRIETAPGAGTSVSLLLPRAATQPAPARGRDMPIDAVPSWHVLVVDDDDAVRHVTADMLADLGCRVQEAESGPEALALLGRPDAPDLLFIDYAMPGMTGLAVAAAAHEMGFRGPVVLATGYADQPEPEAPGEVAPDAVLQKPYTIQELARTLTDLPRADRKVGQLEGAS